MKTKNQELLEKLNKAFANNDSDFILDHLTNNIKWTVIGDFRAEGKEAVAKALKEMEAEEPWEMEVDKVITHGREAAVNGIMKSNDGKQYAFCDVYKFSGFKDPKISEMTSYVLEVKD